MNSGNNDLDAVFHDDTYLLISTKRSKKQYNFVSQLLSIKKYEDLSIGDVVNCRLKHCNEYVVDKTEEKAMFIVDHISTTKLIAGRRALTNGRFSTPMLLNLEYDLEIDERFAESILLTTKFNCLAIAKQRGQKIKKIDQINQSNSKIYLYDEIYAKTEEAGGQLTMYINNLPKKWTQFITRIVAIDSKNKILTITKHPLYHPEYVLYKTSTLLNNPIMFNKPVYYTDDI